MGARHNEKLVFGVNLLQSLLRSLIIRQYYCVFHLRFGNKCTPTKLLRTEKWMIKNPRFTVKREPRMLFYPYKVKSVDNF